MKPWDIPFDELTEGQVITVALKGSAKRYRVKSVTHEGNTWTASVVPADLDDPEAVYWPISAEPTTEPKFDATVLSETAAAAAERRIMAGQVTTFSKTIHHTPEGWSHVVGGESTHQDDDCTQIVHDVMNTLDGALHHDIDCRDVKAILDALKSAGYELVNQVGTVHESPESWQHIVGGPRVIPTPGRIDPSRPTDPSVAVLGPHGIEIKDPMASAEEILDAIGWVPDLGKRMSDEPTYPDVENLPTETETYERYEVYVDSGRANELFRAFGKSLGRAIEISWKDTEYV